MFDVLVRITRLKKALHPEVIKEAKGGWYEVWSGGEYKHWHGESLDHFISRVESDNPIFLTDANEMFNRVKADYLFLLNDPDLFYKGYKNKKSVDKIVSDFASLEGEEEIEESVLTEEDLALIPKSLLRGLDETERMKIIKRLKHRASKVSSEDLEEALDETFEDIVQQDAQEQIEKRLLTRKNLKRRRPDVQVDEDVIYTASQQEVLEKRLASCKKSKTAILSQRLAGVGRSHKIAVSTSFVGPFYEFLEKFNEIAKVGESQLGKAFKNIEAVKEDIDNGLVLLESAPETLKDESLDTAKENLIKIRQNLLRSMELLLGNNFDSFTYNVKEQLRKIQQSKPMKELIISEREEQEKQKQQVSE